VIDRAATAPVLAAVPVATAANVSRAATDATAAAGKARANLVGDARNASFTYE
jgi:hypothetical protein